MRWISAPPKYKEGDLVVVSRFLWLPLELPIWSKLGAKECRWLEVAKVVCEYGNFCTCGMGGSLLCLKDMYFEK